MKAMKAATTAALWALLTRGATKVASAQSANYHGLMIKNALLRISIRL